MGYRQKNKFLKHEKEEKNFKLKTWIIYSINSQQKILESNERDHHPDTGGFLNIKQTR